MKDPKKSSMINNVTPDSDPGHPSSIQRTTTMVLLGSPSPALLTATMRYSNSTPRGWSVSSASVVTAVPMSDHGPSGRCRRRMR